MISPTNLCEIKEKIHQNEEKINLLNGMNVVLKERHEIESNFNHLQLKFEGLKREENERRQKYDQSRKHYLADLESRGAELCKENARVLHQIEHIQWHLEGCTRHKPCQGKSSDGMKKPPVSPSCTSISAPTNAACRPSVMDCEFQANLRNTSERLIKSIIDLRKKIYIVQEKLEHELKRKKEMEKKLSDLRKEISRQKKNLSNRRQTHSHTPMPTTATTTTTSYCPNVGHTTSHGCSSLPPIKKSIMAK